MHPSELVRNCIYIYLIVESKTSHIICLINNHMGDGIDLEK